MGYVYVIIINVILLFIAYVILSNKMRAHSAPDMLARYTREVENLIVELNQSVDDAVTVAEERIEELKELVRHVEKLLKRPTVRKALAAAPAAGGGRQGSSVRREGGAGGTPHGAPSREPAAGGNTPPHGDAQPAANLLERTRHLLAMGHSKDEIARMLGIGRAEVDFLESLSK
jgi:hypothetical protein